MKRIRSCSFLPRLCVSYKSVEIEAVVDSYNYTNETCFYNPVYDTIFSAKSIKVSQHFQDGGWGDKKDIKAYKVLAVGKRKLNLFY